MSGNVMLLSGNFPQIFIRKKKCVRYVMEEVDGRWRPFAEACSQQACCLHQGCMRLVL